MLLLLASFAFGQGTVRWSGGTSTNWSTASNWTVVSGTPSTPPGSGDAVQIGTGAITNQPTLSSATTIASLTYGNSAASTLTINANLTVTGAITNTITTTARIHNINLASGDTLFAASANLSPAVAAGNMTITFNGGAFILSGNFTSQPTTATTTITLSVGTGAFSVGGTTLQGAAANAARNCVISVSTGSLKFSGAYTKDGTGSTLTSSGAATVTFGSTVTNTRGTSFNLTGSTTTFTGSGSAITPTTAMTFGNVSIGSGASPTFGTGTMTISGGLTVDGTLSIAGTTSSVSGTTDINGTLNITSTTGTKTFATVNINANGILNFTAAETAQINGNLTMGNNSSITGSSTGIINVANNLVINGTGAAIGQSTMTVSGTTNITGDVNFNSAIGTKTFVGTITLSGSGGWSSSANSAFILQGGITHNGASFSSGTGIYTFNTNAQSIAGASQLTFANLTATGITVTNNNTNANGLTVSAALAGTGGLTNPINAILNLQGTSAITTLTATAVPNTVKYTGTTSAQTVKAATYHHLIIDNSTQTATISATMTVNGDLTVTSGSLTVSGGTFITSGSTTVNGTMNMGAATAITLNGSTSVYGTMNITSATGTKTFGGLLSINSSGTWNNSSNEAITFQNGLTHNGTSFTAGTGIYTFSNNAQSIGGSSALAIPNLTVTTITLTSTNTAGVTVSTALAGTGGFTNSANSTLTLGGTSAITTLTATASPNTVIYSAAGAQTVKATTYNNLTLSGSGAKTTTGITVNGVLSMEGTATASAAPTYGTSATLQYNTATGRTASVEWISPFAATGGVVIANTGSITANAAKVFNAGVPLTVNNGSSLAMSTFLLTLNGDFINNGGTTSGSGGLTITGTSTQNIGTFTTTGTVSMTKTGGTATLTGNLNGGAFTLNGTGGTLDLGTGLTHTFTGTLTGTAGTLNLSSSTLNLAGSTNVTGGTWNAGTSTVNFNGAGAQSIPKINFYNLKLSTSGTKTFTDTTGIAGDFTVSGATADATTNSTIIDFNGSGSQTIAAIDYYAIIFSSTGLKTFAAGTTRIANTFTIPGAATVDATTNTTTVEFNSPNSTNQISPSITYYNLVVSRAVIGGRLQVNDVTVTHDFTINTGEARLANAGFTVNGTTIINGTASVQGLFSIRNAGATPSFNDLTINSYGELRFTAPANISLNGNFTVNGTGLITNDAGLWSFQKPGGGGTIGGSGTAPLIENAVFTTSYTHSGNFIINDLAVTGTTLTNTGTLTIDSSLTGSGTITQGSSATLALGFTGSPSISTLNATASGNTVQYSFAGVQTIFGTDYANLTLTTSGVKTFSSGTTRIANTLTLGGTATADATTNSSTIEYNGSGAQTIGVLDYKNLILSTGGTKAFGSGTTRIAGSFTVSGATADATTNSPTIEFDGTSSQTIEGISYYNTTINNAAGIVLGGTITVNNTLTLTSGVVSTGSYAVQIGASGSVSRTSGHINGNLLLNIPTGSLSKTFDIGDAINYTPVTIAFTGVTVAGNLTVNTTTGDHPQILTSGIDASQSVNRYWTLSGPSITFTSYDITMNFAAGDIDGGANTATFIIGRYNSGWTSPTVGTLTSSSSQATGVTGFGDFQIGQVSPYTLKIWDGGASTSNWGDANNWNPNGVPTSSNNVDLNGANTIDINVAASANSITLNNASLVVTILSGNSLTVAGDLSIAAGTLNTAATFPAVTGTVNITGGTVAYTNAGAQTISAQTYNNLSLSGSGTKTFASGTTSLTGNLTFGGSATADATTNTTTINYNGSGSQIVGAIDYYNLAFSNAGTKTFASGTSRIANTFSIGGTATADATTNSATIEYNGSGAQSVEAIGYFNLTLATSGTKTLASGTTGIAGSMSTTGTATADATTNSSTVSYNGAGAQNIEAINYYNLTLANTGTKTFSSGTTGIAGDLSISGATADATINSSTISYNGSGSQNVAAIDYYNLTLATSGTKTFAAGTSGIAGSFTLTGSATADATSNTTTVDYNGSGAQSIALATYDNITLSNAGAKQFSAGTTYIQGDITVSGGATLDATTNSSAVEFSGPGAQNVAAGSYYDLTFSNAGVKTIGAGTTQIANAFTITGATADLTTNSTTIDFTGTVNQTAPSITYYNLTSHNSATRLLVNDVTVNNDFTVQTGQARVAGFGLTVVGTTTLNGELRVTATGGTKTLGNVIVNTSGFINFTAAEDLTINGDFQVDGGGAITSNTGLWTFQKTGGGTFSGTTAGVTISNAIITTAYSNSGAFAFDDLNISGTTFTNNGSITITNTLSGTGTFTQGSGSSLYYNSLTPSSVSTLNASASGNTVSYGAAGSQSINVTDYYNLTMTTSGTKTFGSGTTRIAGGFSVSSATADATTNSPTIEFNGSSSQTIQGITYYNATVNNAAGIVLGGTITVNNTLTLTSGIITTGSYTVQIGASGSVSHSSGHVNGNLLLNIPTGTPSRTFDIGDATNYTPVTVAFTGVSTAGDLTMSTTSGDHPQILTSGIEASLSVNRYWTLSGPSIVFTSYNITMNFVSGDVDGGANTANFIIGRYNSGWTLPTVGTLTSTSSQATGVTAFGDFQIGETSTFALKTWDGGASTSNWGDANNWNPNGVPTSSNNVDLTGANTINVDVVASVNSITLNNGSLVVTILSGNSLTVSGDLSIAAGTLNTETSFPAVTGTVNITGGTIAYTNTGAQTISTQTYNNLTLSGSGTKTFSSGTTSLTGDLIFGGSATADAITNTSTIDYNGSGAQVVGAMDYYNLSLSNAGTKTFATGTSRMANTFTIGGTANADATTNSTTIDYNGAGSQTVNAFNYDNLTLSTSGTKTFASGTTGIGGALTISGAIVDVTTNSTIVSYNGSGAQNVEALNYYDLTLATSGTKTLASGTTSVAGSFSITGSASADATTNSTTVSYNGSIAQNVAAANYYNLTLANAGTKTLSSGTTGIASVLTISGTASIDAVANSPVVDYNGAAQTVLALDYQDLTLSNSGTKTLAGGTTTLKGNLTVSGTAALDATTNTTTVEFNGTTTQSSSAVTFYNLVVNKVSNRLTLDNLTVNNNFTITTGEGRLTSGTFTVLGTTDITQLFRVSNASATPILGNIVVNSTGTINYSANAATTVNGNLQVDGSATFTSGTGLWTFQKPGGGGTIGGTASTISITNAAFTTDYTIGSDMTVDGLTVTGANLTNNAAMTLNASFGGTGTFTQGTGSTLSIAFDGSSTITTLNASAANNLVQYNSAGTQDIVAANYYNLTLTNAGTKSFTSGSTGIANTLSIAGSAAGDAATNNSTIDYNGSGSQNVVLLNYHSLTFSNNGVKTIPSGAFTVEGDFQITGAASADATTNSTTVDFNGTSAQQIAGATFYDVTMSGSNTKTLTGAATLRDLVISGTATLDDGGYQITGNASGTLTLGAGTTLTLGSTSTATIFPTNFINANITLNSSSTVNYNSDQAQVISGIPTYGNLSLSATSAVIKTLAAAATINGNLAIDGNNTFDDAGYQITGNASGTMTMAAGTTLKLGNASTGTNFPTNYTNVNTTLNATSTVIYNSDQAQTISATPTYGYLTLSSTGSVTKTIGGSITVESDLTINANNILAVTIGNTVQVNNGDFILFGDVTNNGTINVGQ